MHNAYWNPTALTRRALIKALSTPGQSRAAVREIAGRFIGNAPVPPSWSLKGVRSTFGRRVAREWARHLRHRTAGWDLQVRSRRHVVQTRADFGKTSGSIEAIQFGDAERQLLVADEFHLLVR